MGRGTGACLRWSVLRRSLKEVVYELGSDKRHWQPSKDLGKDQQHKYFAQSKICLKQNEQQSKIQEVSDKGAQKGSGGSGFGVFILLDLLYDSYRTI